MQNGKWEFWIDRGGTFTDIVAKNPEGELIVYKLLSENAGRYTDAPVQGIREIMRLSKNEKIPVDNIEVIKMGTTVATNALLERKGEPTVFVITKGFRDILRIGYQNRPDIFSPEINLPDMLYEKVIEVDERYSADGKELIPFLESDSYHNFINELQDAFDSGIRSCAIVLMHGYKYPKHEKEIAEIAKKIGFTHISVSHEVSPLMKIVSRGDTTVADAYLSPVLKKYINNVISELVGNNQSEEYKDLKNRLMFMQSNGGLIESVNFRGKDSILSGPAGGIIGAVQISKQAGFEKIITFDMGGTSTDVAHYNGDYERDFETNIAGIRLRTPILSIHTVAAGGGSILSFDGSRFRVGPESAGADPGPACYRKNGPLTVTDCNIMLGRIQPQFFPHVFGENGDLPLDIEVVKKKFKELSNKINDATGGNRTPEEVASGFLDIAVENMANAIKKISLQRGYDVSEYILCCYGGAGGQHACQIADVLGIKKILIHPYAGVLSAYGMGLADIRIIKQHALEKKLSSDLIKEIKTIKERLEKEGTKEINSTSKNASKTKNCVINSTLHLKYEGTDFTLQVKYNNNNYGSIKETFENTHRQMYGFIYEDKDIIVESISVEVINKMDIPQERVYKKKRNNISPELFVDMYDKNRWVKTPVYMRSKLQPGASIIGPAIIVEDTGTNVVIDGWCAEITEKNYLILSKVSNKEKCSNYFNNKNDVEKADPVKLEIFNNLFRSIAEQMGITLQKTAFSVNIKERLDFSCAVFDETGRLVANAPHIPVHLGSMGASVKALIKEKIDTIQPGDVFVSNNPYNGGTHLPDITVITPVFVESGCCDKPVFYVASRGHHADIGGITPGSMPPFSEDIEQEGILLNNVQIVKDGVFLEKNLVKILSSGKYPVRNIEQNIADLKAQIAANEKGEYELKKIVKQYGLETVISYMKHVQDNAEESVRRAISSLKDGEFAYKLDSGEQIKVKITINHKKRSAKIDFTGTSKQVKNNFNAPVAVTKAAVLYVFRCLVNDDIPLNDGCLKPLQIIVPEGSILNPDYPAAVVAGNVETSQVIVDVLFGALGFMAASQGTMNNFTFGNEKYQYYETICGGSGAGKDFNGTDAVQTHMTNSRITDPEVFEWRYPAIIEEFSIREKSGGKGLYYGGNGVKRKIRFLENMTAAILSNRRKVSPFGLLGGSEGLTGKNYIIRNNGEIENLEGTAVVEMNSGDVFVIETPGGGGFKAE
ncbi:MAG: hypothetical protein PWP31_6 [Clostridia bacterium]|nr:hypothetical protein [Clostridia bacterium]